MYREKQKALIKSLEKVDATKLFVHSDCLKTMPLIRISAKKNEILAQHIKLLQALVVEDGLICPTFNYTFPSSRMFDLDKTQSQVGHISEFYRTEISTWRTVDPMFSSCGTGANPFNSNHNKVCPFSDESVFSHLVGGNGHVLFYGASLNSATIIHYAEYISEVKYRYWKQFKGSLFVKNKKSELTLNSHFRPMGKSLDYDWGKIKEELLVEGILKIYNSSVMGLDAKQLIDFWSGKLADNHLYFLDNLSKSWVEPMLEKLGRSFLASDFEVLK